MSATAFTNCRLWDGTGRPLQPGATVVVEGQRITAVQGGGAALPAGTRVVDLGGKFLIPGLLNLHGHLGWDGYRDLETQSKQDGDMVYLVADRSLRAALEAGVTTYRDLGVHHAGAWAKQAIKRGMAVGPRVFTVAASIMCTGGHTWWVGRQADGPDEVRLAVREQVRMGCDWIKIMIGNDRMGVGYSRAEVVAAVEEAHMHGKLVATDAIPLPAAKLAVEAGVDTLEHGGDWPEDFCREIAARGIWVVPTFSPLVLQAKYGEEWGLRPEIVARRKANMANPVRLTGVARARRAGVSIAFGTDAGSPVVPSSEVVPELQALIEFGVCTDAADALGIATRESAKCLRLGKELGTVEAGKLADLVVVDGDPFADLENLRQVDKVFVAGRQLVDGGQVMRGL